MRLKDGVNEEDANYSVIDKRYGLSQEPNETVHAKMRTLQGIGKHKGLFEYSATDAVLDYLGRNELYSSKALNAFGVVSGSLGAVSGAGLGMAAAPLITPAGGAAIGGYLVHGSGNYALEQGRQLVTPYQYKEGARALASLGQPVLSQGKELLHKGGAVAVDSALGYVGGKAIGASLNSKTVQRGLAKININEFKMYKQKGMHNPKIKNAAKRGREEHKKLEEKVKAKARKLEGLGIEPNRNWKSEERIYNKDRSKYIKPDVITPAGYILELKPKTVSGIKKGKEQLDKYKEFTPRKSRIIYYDPKE